MPLLHTLHVSNVSNHTLCSTQTKKAGKLHKSGALALNVKRESLQVFALLAAAAAAVQ